MEIDHTYTKNIVCPYCGYEDRDSWELSEDNEITTCGSCGEDFNYERIVTVKYSTSKRLCKEHKYELRKDYPKHFNNRTSDYSTGRLSWIDLPEDRHKWYRCETCSVCQHERMVEISKDEYALI